MADDSQFQINLVTPERILLTGMATEVMLRTGEGDATFLAGHTPLVGTVQPGVVRVVRPEGDEVRVAVHGGFTQVEQDVALDAEGADEDVDRLPGDPADRRGRAGRGDRRRPGPGGPRGRRGPGGRARRARATGRPPRARRPTPSWSRPRRRVLRAQVRLEAVDASTAASA